MTKLPLLEKVAYGTGDLASNLIFNAVTTYLMFYYTDSVGISAAVASTLFLISRFWDAFSDPMMGAIGDRTRTRWGRFRPYLLFVPVPFGVIAVLTYTSPDFGMTGKIIWACVTYLLLMTAYTAVNIPYGSMATVITRDSHERAQLTTYRMIFAFGGGMLLNAIMLPLVNWYAGDAESKIGGYQFAVAVLSVMAILLYWFCFAFTRERVSDEPEVKPELGKELKTVLQTRAWWTLLAMGILMFALAIFPFYSGMYFLKYVFLNESFAATYFTVLTTGMLGGALVNLILVRFINQQTLAIVAGIWGAVFSMGAFFVQPGQSGMLVVLGFLAFMGTGMGAPNLWAMVADTADYIEEKTGRRIAGLTTSAVSFSMKIGLGVGGSAVGYILAYAGFVANVDANPEVQSAIRMMVSIFPAVGYAAFAVAAWTFPVKINGTEDPAVPDNALLSQYAITEKGD